MTEKQFINKETATRRLFDEDSSLKEFHAMVISCEKAEEDAWNVVLDQTAFFPEGGGQAGDTGWLNEIPVTDTKEKDGVIFHKVNVPLEIGSQVSGKLDYKERFMKMQQHTGEHILSGIVHALYGYENVGFHLGDEVTTMDFDGELTPEQVQDAEIRANKAIFANLPILIHYPSKEELRKFTYRSKMEIEGQVRLVEIQGVDLCACCAPHVKMTGEVGILKILNCERHRGGCRLTIVCGMRAVLDYQQKQQMTGKLSAMLSAKQDQLDEALLHLQEQQQKLREQLNRVQAVYLKEKVEKISQEDQCVCIFEETLDPVAMRNFVNGAMERCDGICGAFIGNETEGYRYILGSSRLDIRETAKKLNAQFHGKGGGKPQMVQGSLNGTETEIRSYLGSLI